jgi:cytochrome b
LPQFALSNYRRQVSRYRRQFPSPCSPSTLVEAGCPQLLAVNPLGALAVLAISAAIAFAALAEPVLHLAGTSQFLAVHLRVCRNRNRDRNRHNKKGRDGGHCKLGM